MAFGLIHFPPLEIMSNRTDRKILVTGATGFIGRALVAALRTQGHSVVAASRRERPTHDDTGVEWRTCDLLDPATLPSALSGIDVAYYLVHSMGGGHSDFMQLERRAAQAFADAAASAGLKRIIYLGGPAPTGSSSEHLQSRLAVGEILRAGPVPTVELRASMVIGHGSASWQIVRDLAMRLPAMVLPKWLKSRTRPVALDDVITALMAAKDVELTQSEWFDVPGPEVMSGRQILERIAALNGRRILAVEVPFLTPRLSALWLILVTRADFSLARELVLGLGDDLLPKDDRYWQLIGHRNLIGFDEAARRALSNDPGAGSAQSQRIVIFVLAVMAWLIGFVLLLRFGTWLSFAILGPALATLAIAIDPGVRRLLRPSLSRVGLGLAAGSLMVMVTQVVFFWMIGAVPEIGIVGIRLYELLQLGSPSSILHVGLIAAIAGSEEVIFRGALLGQAAQGNSKVVQSPTYSERMVVIASAIGYALAMLSLGSGLLVLCAFGCAIAWGGLRVISRSLVAPIVAHIVWIIGVLVVWPLVNAP